MNKKIFSFLVLSLFPVGFHAQKTFILWDKMNNLPVSRASVYSTLNGNVKSTYSNEDGRVSVDFTFDCLTISHINYKKKTIENLPDTLYLEPNSQLLPEITISAGEPSWIRPLLKKIVKLKETKYGCRDVFKYEYQTQNVGNSTLYGFESKGLLRKNDLYEISPTENTITYKDKTAGCDFSNLKNTFYHNFVSDIDVGFIKDHKFFVDDQPDNKDKNVVKIFFKSQKVDKDSGYFSIDTLNCIVLSAKRSTGLEYNVKERTNPLVRATINTFYGHKYKDWQIDYQVDYQKRGNTYYLSSCKYSNCMLEDFNRKKMKGLQFYHVISTFTAEPCLDTINVGIPFLKLPKPWAMKIFMSKKETSMEKQLQNVDKKYNIY